MKDNINHSEFLFLSALERCDPKFQFIYVNSLEQQRILGLHQSIYVQMVITLAEDGYITFQKPDFQLLVGRLRREIALSFPRAGSFNPIEWANPRDTLDNRLIGNETFQLQISFRGLRRLEELRELLKRDRILEPFGVLLDMRYFVRDLEEALRRPADVPVSVLRLDMDNFKRINEEFGHLAGDVVMKSYLEAVRDSLHPNGIAFRGRGDEIVALLVGQEHSRAAESAEKIRVSVEALRCKLKETHLPGVTTSIGVATTPPEPRHKDLETVADGRQNRAKREGKNRVIAN